MKKLTTQINESLQTVVNEAANPIAKSLDALFKTIGLKEMKLTVPSDMEVDDEQQIGKLLLQPSDAGMLQSMFKTMTLTVTLTKMHDKHKYNYILKLKYSYHFVDGHNNIFVAEYGSSDNGQTWNKR